jgi:hypothetical protein
MARQGERSWNYRCVGFLMGVGGSKNGKNSTPKAAVTLRTEGVMDAARKKRRKDSVQS